MDKMTLKNCIYSHFKGNCSEVPNFHLLKEIVAEKNCSFSLFSHSYRISNNNMPKEFLIYIGLIKIKLL